MRAMRASRVLLACWICVAVSCSSKPSEEKTMASVASSLVTVGWEGTGAMAEARKLHTGVVLPSGKVLTMGGYNSSGYLRSATQYDPETGLWTVVAPMPEARQEYTATVLNTGRVLVMGGVNSTGHLASAAVYDPATNVWASAGAFASGGARSNLTATVLPLGKVLVVGGKNLGGAQNKVDVYDPETGTWEAWTPLLTARSSHTATLLMNGKVLLVGGWSGGATGLAEVYDPVSKDRSAMGSLATARYDHTATLLPSGKVLVVGGRNSAGVVETAELYDPSTGQWSPARECSATSPCIARAQHTATLLSTGKVLVAGGQYGSASTDALASAEVYDPATGQWSAAAAMPGARYQHVAVPLDALGKILVVGGVGASGSSQKTADLYVYDACAGVSCNSAPGSCYEAAGTCAVGVCSYAPKASGVACDDGNACTGGDACNGAGACAGSAISCSSPPGQCYVAAGTCSGGTCDYEHKAAGAECNDGDACTVGEVCNGAGGCAGTLVSCTSPPGQCYEAAGTCSEGACTYAPKAVGTACDDGNASTINDMCSGAGVCAGLVACTTPPSACHDSPGTYTNGVCTYPFKGAGTLCDDANACTTADMCNGLGTCGGTEVVCNSPPNSCYSAAGVCGSGTCSYTPEPAGFGCTSDNNACTQDVCDGAGACSHPLEPAGTSCGSGLVCNSAGQCLNGCWISGAYYAVGATNPAGDCQECNPSVSTSSWSNKSVGTACGAPSYGSWGSCGGYNGTCGETGSQSRTVTAHACTGSGTCAGSNSSETRACTRSTNGASCGSDYDCSECGGFNGDCGEVGTQSCTWTEYTCFGGTCSRAHSGSGESMCWRNTDGESCGSDQNCSECGGFDSECDQTGTQSCTSTQYSCSSGTCRVSGSSFSQAACSRSTEGNLCGSLSHCNSTCYGSDTCPSGFQICGDFELVCRSGGCSGLGAITRTWTECC